METDRGGGDKKGRGRGRGWRGPHRGRDGSGNKQANFERHDNMHFANATGGSPFLHPQQNTGEAMWSNTMPTYENPPPRSREFDHPFGQNFKTEHQNQSYNLPNSGGQGWGNTRGGYQNYEKSTPHYAPRSPSSPFQFPPPQNPQFNPGRFNPPSHQHYGGPDPNVGREFQNRHHPPRGNFNNFNHNHRAGYSMPNPNNRFRGPPPPHNSQNFQSANPNMDRPFQQQFNQEAFGLNPGLEMPRAHAWNSETNLHRVNSVGSLNSEKSLNLNKHSPKKMHPARSRRNRRKDKLQNDLSSTGNPLNVGLEMSDGNRPISRSSSYSNDPTNDIEHADCSMGISSNKGKQNQNFRRVDRGGSRARLRNSFSGASGQGEGQLDRSSINSDSLNDFEQFNVPLDSGEGNKRTNNRRKNQRGRGKGSGYQGSGPTFSKGGENEPFSRTYSNSYDQDSDNTNEMLNTLPNEINQSESQQNTPRGSGNQRGRDNNIKTRVKAKQTEKDIVKNKHNLPKSNITLDQVEQLKKCDPIEIVQILSKDGNEYSSLWQEDLDPKVLISVVDILSKICETPSSQQRLEILRHASLPAFTSQMFNYITEYPYLEDEDILQQVNQFFENTISFYETLADVMPSGIRMWHNHIVEVLKSLKVMTNNPKIQLNPYLLNKAKDLLDEVKHDVKVEVEEVKKQGHEKKKETYDPEPVGDFRTVSLYPRPQDVYDEQPFLYPNITKGPYRSVDHYLDTHFKLLREDFMSPIRQAMREYKKKRNTKDKFKRVDNVKIYRRVKFLHPKTVFDVVGYEICFDVDNKMNRINWEFCSRFMYGSLLLFSNDDFDSFFMATVINRNVKELENKRVTVELVERLDNMKSILGKEFIMAESEAYFNPYFQVLKALQRFNETNFPLAQYIVHANTETRPPIYLNFAEIYSIKMAGNSFTFPVLSDMEWPTHEQLGLDISQYGAFKAALTNDLTVIQGPPGTGKTFLGLKIAHALLENAHVWNNANTPIFVVCFTNHALDQFLEGLLPVTTKLVRIGGKSKGGELDKFNIRERRKEGKYYHDTNGREKRNLELKMSTVFADIKVYQTNLNVLENTAGVISVRTLQFVMTEEQRNYFAGDDDFMDWLLEGVAGTKNKEKVKITITADRGVVQEAPTVDPLIADAEDFRVKQAFFDTIDLDTNVGPSEDTVSVQIACDLASVTRKRDELLQLLRGNGKLHRSQLLQIRNTCESLDVLIAHLSKELQNKKFPRSNFEREKLVGERYLRHLLPDDRWRLYHTWVNILRDGLIVTLGNKDALYKEYAFQYEQLRQNNDLQILRRANVVGTTTTLAAKYQPMFEALAPRIVIVEEAAEVLEAHIIASLSKSCQHLILIGDHKQLRPQVAEVRLARQYQLDVSLFERLVLNEMACHTLTLQHRMRPEISRQLVPTIYPVLRDDDSVLGRDDIRGMDKNVFFMTHKHFEDEVTEITSKRNRFEAEILLHLAKYLVQQGYKPQEITILATYKGQMYHMKNEIKTMSDFPRGIQITVVDNFQGEENKIILLSLVRSNQMNKIGFLEIENRICVALSRARDGFYILGNMNCLVANSEIWAKIRNSLATQKCYGPALNLRCQIHRDQLTKIESAKDFSKVSEGGCSLLCGQPLPCGHSCRSMCHVEQDYHQRYKCKEPCSKILCAEGHQCPKKCHQACGQCQIPMRRELGCRHFANVPCHMDVREHPCTELVQVQVPFCNHVVTVPCHTRFHPTCNLPCTKRLECGHSCEQQCHEMEDPDHLDYACLKPCARLNLNCSKDHKCEMACFEECKPCPEKVIRELPCGHSLKVLCSADLTTIVCKQKCEKVLDCGHPCTKKCFQGCQPCLIPVKKKVMGCEHEMEVACSTAAVRQICTGRCTNTLGCGHQCSNLCKDTCSAANCVQPVTVRDEKNLTTLLSRLKINIGRSKQFPMLCGHNEAQVPCNRARTVEYMTPEELMQYCSEPCGKELTCGHICSGTCSQCLQGRIHKMCNEQCGNVLICGHSCKVPCRELCPPCKEPCRHECKHSKCSRKCGEECVPCKEPCDYSCEHLKCSRRCGELCDRDPCYEPCREKLDCGHSCVGYCGEPCPPCRKCEPKHFEEIFFMGEETEEDSKWVVMVDCGHTVESTGLEMWLNMEQEGGEIGCKVCPRCKTPIVKVQRFMNLIKQTYLDIQQVKANCFGKRDEIKRERAQALRKIQNVNYASFNEPDDELEKMFIELKTELPEVKGKKKNTIDAQKLRVLCFWTEFFISVYTRKQDVWTKLDEESKQKLSSKINNLTKLLMKRHQKISDQEMQSFEGEVKRIHRLSDLLVYASSSEFLMAYSVARETRTEAESVICSVSAYDDQLDKRAKLLLTKLKEQIRSSTEITAEEKAMINKAMSSSFRSQLKTGHWFKCKNGHLYCITECGGAMQEAVCPVRGCGEIIGGQQHRLRADQSLASEMDGATHAAWSDANNMANYRFF